LAAESLEQRQQIIDMVLQSGKLVERPLWNYFAEMDEEQRKLIDEELWARVTTFYLQVDQPLKPLLVYTPGMFNGSWQGRILVSQRNIVIKYYISDIMIYPGSNRDCFYGVHASGRIAETSVRTSAQCRYQVFYL
jgi:hypothetical protein